MGISSFCKFLKGKDAFPVITMVSIPLSDRNVMEFKTRYTGVLRQLLKAFEQVCLDLLVVKCLNIRMDLALNHRGNIYLEQCTVLQGY